MNALGGFRGDLVRSELTGRIGRSTAWTERPFLHAAGSGATEPARLAFAAISGWW
jgi:hypothetical protein